MARKVIEGRTRSVPLNRKSDEPALPFSLGDHDRLIALEASLREFREALDLRLHTLNELREDVVKDRTEFLRQDVYEENHRRLEESLRKDIDILRSVVDTKQPLSASAADRAIVDATIIRITALEKYQARLAGAIGLLGTIFAAAVIVWEAVRR